jgi:small subunit ribosomal protein S21
MLIIPVKEGESIEKALKKFKRKVEKTGLIKNLRERQKFTKPSVVFREKKIKAIYKQKMQQGLEEA